MLSVIFVLGKSGGLGDLPLAPVMKLGIKLCITSSLTLFLDLPEVN